MKDLSHSPQSAELMQRLHPMLSRLDAKSCRWDEPPVPVQFLEVPAGPLRWHEYWRIVCRRKGAIALFALLCTSAAFLCSLRQTPIYQAHTTLEILGLNEN